MIPEPVVIIGAGGFGRETREVVRACATAGHPIRLHGYLDDDPDLHGKAIGGAPIIGPIEASADLLDARFVIATGSPADYFSRALIRARLDLPDERFVTLIHPAAVVPASCTVGPGSVLSATVVLTADVEVGCHVNVMPGTILTHDDRIGDFATFGAGARVAGRVSIGDGAYIGSGSMIREDLSIGPWSLVGMGSVVTRDVPLGEVWAGAPARRIASVDVPIELQGPCRVGRGRIGDEPKKHLLPPNDGEDC